MASYTEEQLDQLITDAVPPHAYRVSPREWTWTRPTGIWSLNICVRTTRSEVDAALRFLVAVGAIDRHPDDPTAIEKP